MKNYRVLVVGQGKSGTTVISKTIHNTLALDHFVMEPSHLDQFPRDQKSMVAKILFGSWSEKLDDLIELVEGRAGVDLSHVLCIVRDPRDELISNLHYAAYNFFFYHDYPKDMREEWIDIFRQKEQFPAKVALSAMCEQLQQRFGLHLGHLNELRAIYEEFLVTIQRPYFLLRYEDFIAEDIYPPELQYMLSGSREVGSGLARVCRSKSTGAWRNYFLEEELANFNRENEELLMRYNYPTTATGDIRKINPEECSVYVARLIQDALRHRKQAIEFGANIAVKSFVNSQN